NMRVLKWIVERCEGKAAAKDTPIGRMPRYEDLDWQGLNVTPEDYEKLTNVDAKAWREEVKDHSRLFEQLKSRLPNELAAKRNELEQAIR
ncbi:MAG: phosphoenolpyruvate carboxykinase domain-containing protein, partial [Burkholderiales bacterium]